MPAAAENRLPLSGLNGSARRQQFRPRSSRASRGSICGATRKNVPWRPAASGERARHWSCDSYCTSLRPAPGRDLLKDADLQRRRGRRAVHEIIHSEGERLCVRAPGGNQRPPRNTGESRTVSAPGLPSSVARSGSAVTGTPRHSRDWTTSRRPRSRARHALRATALAPREIGRAAVAMAS